MELLLSQEQSGGHTVTAENMQQIHGALRQRFAELVHEKSAVCQLLDTF